MRLLISTILVISLWSTCGLTSRVDNKNEQREKPALTVTYIANEGVLISSGSTQVLIDGLHRQYKPEYAVPPQQMLESMEAARPPYNEIDLLLVTHIHLDHFHPQSVGQHLKNNSKAVLVSSDQIADGIKKEFEGFGEIESRVRRVNPGWKTTVSRNDTGIDFKVLGLRHGGAQFSWIQNLGYLIEMDGKKFLHIGDADVSEENFASFRLHEEGIDVAFIPFWFLLSPQGRSLVREQFRAKQIIGMHISPAEVAAVTEQLKKVYPEAILFTKILETRTF